MQLKDVWVIHVRVHFLWWHSMGRTQLYIHAQPDTHFPSPCSHQKHTNLKPHWSETNFAITLGIVKIRKALASHCCPAMSLYNSPPHTALPENHIYTALAMVIVPSVQILWSGIPRESLTFTLFLFDSNSNHSGGRPEHWCNWKHYSGSQEGAWSRDCSSYSRSSASCGGSTQWRPHPRDDS